MMEWPATQTNSSAVRIISLPASVSALLVSPFPPSSAPPTFRPLDFPFPRSEIFRANLNEVVSFFFARDRNELAFSVVRSSLSKCGCDCFVIVSTDCKLVGDYPRYFYVSYVESFFLTLFRRDLYKDGEDCILFELYSSIKFRDYFDGLQLGG